jgi:hypothetical protein
MATMTYETGAVAARVSGNVRENAPVAASKPGLFTRIFKAIERSRMQRAEIEIRRVRAIMADTDSGFKDALLPFRGE